MRLLLLSLWLLVSTWLPGDGDPDPGGDPAGGDGDPDPTGAEKMFTQADLDRHAAARAQKAEKAARSKLAEEWGVPIEDVGKLIAERREADAGKLSEAEKAKQEAERLKNEAATIRAEAVTERRTGTVERLLRKAGMSDEKQVAATAPGLVAGLAADADDDDVAAAVASFRETFAPLFAAETATATGTHRPARERNTGGAASALERGAERAKRFHPQTT